jgi:hypothetical protein
MTDPANLIRLDVQLLKTLQARVAELEVQVSALRRDLAMVRQNASDDVMYQLVEAFRRVPQYIAEMDLAGC